MRLPQLLPPRLLRHALAVAALLAQLVAATGAPVPSHVPAARSKSASTPFPCQDHPCGCSTSEQGWAGDCCCFTLEQKLAWADSRGIEPPPHVRPAVESRKAAPKAETCCSKKKGIANCDRADDKADEDREQAGAAKPGIRWVVGVFAQKCRGEGFGGLLKLELVVVPEIGASLRDAFAPTESVRAVDSRVTVTSFCPPTPPPRLA